MEGGGAAFQQPYEVSELASWLRPAGGEESMIELAKTKMVCWLAMLRLIIQSALKFFEPQNVHPQRK